MQRVSLSAAVVASSVMWSAGAPAADMPGLPPMLPSPPIVQEFFSDWYLRADFGYRFHRFAGGSAFDNSFTSMRDKESVAFGGGIGMRVHQFRGDVTVDYGQSAKFAGAATLGSPDVTAKFRNLTVLFNAYVDLAPWYGVSPYVGGGVGFSYLQAYDVAAILIPADTAVSNPAALNMSWAAIAGLTIPVTYNLKVDLNYRYLDLGSARSSTDAGTIRYRDMSAHEIRLGLRYMPGG